MLVIIAIDILYTLTLIVNYLSNLQILLSGLDIETAYSSPNLQFEKYELSMSADIMTMDETKDFCAGARARVFYVLEGMDLSLIFNAMQTDQVWINMVKSKTGIIIDAEGFSPIISTKGTDIDSNDLLTPLTETQAVSLTRTPGEKKKPFKYERVEKTSKRTALCMKEIKPVRQAVFRDRLIQVRDLALIRLAERMSTVKEIRMSTEKKLMLLPKIGNDTNVTTVHVRTPQNLIENEIEYNLNKARNELMEKIMGIEDRLDVEILTTRLDTILDEVMRLTYLAVRPLSDPFSFLDSHQREIIQTGYTPKLLRLNSTSLIISLGPEFVSIEGQKYLWTLLFNEDFFELNLVDCVFIVWMWFTLLYLTYKAVRWCKIQRKRALRLKNALKIPRVRKVTQAPRVRRRIRRTNDIEMYSTGVDVPMPSRYYDNRRARMNRKPLFELGSELSLYR